SLKDLFCFINGAIAALAADRPPFHLKRAMVRIRAEFAAATDEGGVERTGTLDRVRRSRLNVAIELFQPCQDSSHAQDGVAALIWTAAMRCDAFGRNLHPLKA